MGKWRRTIEFFEDTEGLERAKKTKSVLIDTHERIGMILDLLPVGLIIHQQQGILFANQAASALLGHDQETLVGHHFLDHLGDTQAKELDEEIHRAFDDDEIIKKPKLFLSPPGKKQRIVTATIAKLPWEGTPVVQILLQDITVQVERERQLENLMATDGLTGAQNRRSFIDYVDQLASNPEGSRSGILLWDIDFFKNVNDTFGHQAGDITLKKVVLECEELLAQRALVEHPNLPRPMLARFGGEEFAVIIPASDMDESLAYAEKIRSMIENLTIETGKHSISITISIGMVMGDLQVDDIDILLGMADKALYAAKENGRNQIVCAQTSMQMPPSEKRVSRDGKRSNGKRRIH